MTTISVTVIIGSRDLLISADIDTGLGRSSERSQLNLECREAFVEHTPGTAFAVRWKVIAVVTQSGYLSCNVSTAQVGSAAGCGRLTIARS